MKTFQFRYAAFIHTHLVVLLTLRGTVLQNHLYVSYLDVSRLVGFEVHYNWYRYLTSIEFGAFFKHRKSPVLTGTGTVQKSRIRMAEGILAFFSFIRFFKFVLLLG
jgi:hypothetical protein